ncbi:MAG: response regulator [Pseudoclavibacter sp.]
MSDHIGVLIVDDHAMVRRGLMSFFDVLADIRTVGEAPSGEEALRVLDRLATKDGLPDVALIDLMMPGLDGLETAREISRRYEGLQTIIMTGFDDLERVHDAIASGVAGYVMKDASPAEVETAVRAAAAGQLFLAPAVARRFTQDVLNPPPTSVFSEREKDVLSLVGKGMSNRQIASALVISERTARTHVSNILGKLGVESRTQAALYAVREGYADG